MPTFHSLELRSRTLIAEDAVRLEFAAPPGLAERYRFEAGQHLPVRATIGGRELRRTYSIVSPAGGALCIGVRVQGAMSRYLAENLPVGGTLEALEPSGRFKPALDPVRAKSYVAIVAGSGITPVLSIAATVLARECASRMLLIYGNRDLARTMFLEEVMALKNRFLGRFAARLLMSREPQEIDLFNGRIDAARLRELARTEFEPREIDEFFVCGPGSMVKTVAATLRELGASGTIHFERFTVDERLPGERYPTAGAAELGDVEVAVTMDGRRRGFRMAAGRTILEAAETAGLSLPYSCRAGVCSTCRAKVIRGGAAMERNQALEDWEVRSGFILCCQARPTSDRVEISYDEV